MSAKARLTGRSSRSGESPKSPGMRLVAMRNRSMAAMLSPRLGPAQVEPVSSGAAKGSNPALQKSRRIALQTFIAKAESNSST